MAEQAAENNAGADLVDAGQQETSGRAEPLTLLDFVERFYTPAVQEGLRTALTRFGEVLERVARSLE